MTDKHTNYLRRPVKPRYIQMELNCRLCTNTITVHVETIREAQLYHQVCPRCRRAGR